MLLCQLQLLVTCLHVCIRAALGQTAADDCPVPVQVLVKDSASTSGHRLRFGPSGPDQDSTCEVSWISHELFSLEREASAEGADTDALDSAVLSQDFVLTDGLKRVPFAGRKGRLAFLERILPMPRLDNEQLDSILAGKELLISVLLPRKNSKAWADVQTRTIAHQAAAVLPDHTFFDDGMAVTYEQAFVPYRFSLIVDDDNGTVSQAFVHCIGWGTIPLFNGFSHIVAMLPRIVVPWDPVSFRVEGLLSFLPGINYDIASLWQQHRLVQDQLLYRYSRGFNESLKAVTCHLCAYKQTRREDDPKSHEDGLPPLVFVGVYSAKDNSPKRDAIRDTWAQAVRTHGLELKFFLGRPRLSPRFVPLQAEMAKHRDVILLDVQEGYKWNSVKGLMFLEWCAQNVLARFIVKADDDIYFRPDPLLFLLQSRPSYGYIWGYFDYFSPVPKDEDHAFYNPADIYPFEVFPPYARGLLRVLSADVVLALARLSFAGKLPLVYGDDPCFGVHLRYLRDDKLGLPMLTLDDRDSYRVFAMEPSCNPGLWSHATRRSWVVHHVSPEQIYCMWTADASAGLYKQDVPGNVQLAPEAIPLSIAAANVATQDRLAFEEPPPMPDVCNCLEFGPLASELSNRRDKINASRTYMTWGHPGLLEKEMQQ
ncbi:GALT1 [Symbiodinium sp. CCMP2592]|nr:GALT1 [Symbiodinium sp. CCMP2592]